MALKKSNRCRPFSPLWHAMVLAGLTVALFGAACTNSTADTPASATTIEMPEIETPIEVLVGLPQTGQMDLVNGWVIDSDGERVAEFEIGAGFVFLEGGSAENDWRPATSLTGNPTTIAVQLPGPGIYTFEIGDVGYWGGCGTCGRGFDGGSVQLGVRDGSRVELDLGVNSWVS